MLITKYLTLIKFNTHSALINTHVPATGLPKMPAMPWNRSRRPKAFVNFSKPNNSTRRMERKEANAAGKKKTVTSKACPILSCGHKKHFFATDATDGNKQYCTFLCPSPSCKGALFFVSRVA